MRNKIARPLIKSSMPGCQILERYLIKESVLFLIILGTFIPVHCQDEYPPRAFQTIPNCGSTATTGSNKFLYCQASSNPNPKYRWLKDGSYITNTSTTDVSHIITNIKRSEAGFYQCTASNNLGTIMSTGCNIVVAYLDWLSSPVDRNIDVDQRGYTILTLTDYTSVPDAYLFWKKGPSGVVMNVDGPHHFITKDGNLVLLDVEMSSNNEQYHAEAVNGQLEPPANKKTTGSYTLNVQAQSGSVVPPTIVVPPSNTNVSHRADAATLECVVNASPIDGLSIKWYKVSENARNLLSTDVKYVMSQYKHRLQIRQPTESDTGVYECEAVLTTPDGSVHPTKPTAQATLTVFTIPIITVQIQQDYSRDYGQTLEVPCKATGEPAPTIHWYFNAEPVESLTSSKHSVLDDGTLKIVNMDLEDSGMYQCFAKNDEGAVHKSTWIKVNSSPPTFIKSPADLTVVEGSNARLSCEVSGAPKPTVVWTKVVGTTETTVVSQGRYQLLDRGELLITTTVSTDSGLFRCSATNSRGSISADANLRVLVRTQIVAPPQNTSQVIGEAVEMPCGVSHDPNVQITLTWYKYEPDNIAKTAMTPSSEVQIKTDGTLRISKVYNQYIGKYECEVISTGGNDSRSAFLSVLEKPHQPIIQSASVVPDNVRAVNLTWSLAFDGNSPIQRFILQYRQVYYVPGRGITEGPNEGWITYQFQVPPTPYWFVMPNLRPARSYQFRISAVNSVGEGIKSEAYPNPPITMPEQPPGGPPKGFFGSARTNSSIMLQWQAPDEDKWNGDLIGYTIRYKLAGYHDSSYTMQNTSNWPLTSFELKGLITFIKYEIQIAAYNSKGIGVWSGSINVTTMEGRPIKPPTEIEATAINSTTVQVKWKPPLGSFINGINLGYRIFTQMDSETASNFRVAVPPSPSSPNGIQTAFLHDLKKYTNYTLTVTCYTSKGDGPFSSPVSVQTDEDVPDQVGSLQFANILDTSLKVIWTRPANPNGILLGYKLEWEKKNKSSPRRHVDLNENYLSFTIRELSPSTKYTIYIQAHTVKGYGPPRTADIESGVPPERPTAPYNLGVSDIQSRSVLLQFWPGYNGKTSITNWIVEGEENGGSTWKKVYEISDPDATSITVQNLLPYTYYRLRITAVNIVGPSNASVPSRKFQTLQDAPNVPPDNIRVRAINATSLRVSWAPLSKENWNGAPKGYQIYYKLKIGNSMFQMVELDMDKDSYILSKLEEWMEYEVKMKAFNDVGSSGYSPVAVERTQEAKPSSGPLNVQAAALTSTSIRVSWSDVPPLHQNGMIMGYKIQFESEDAGIDPKMQTVEGNTTHNADIQGLRKYVQYQVQVLAYTRMGDGTLSLPKFNVRTHQDVPGPPVKLWSPEVTYTTAKVVWSPPLEPNGIILNYRVSYRIQNQNNQVSSQNLDKSVFEYTVATLQRETYYVFSVTARTELGWGDPAEVLVFTMINRRAPDRPQKPTISTSEVESRAVTIGWIPEFDGYGPLRNYTIQYKRKSGAWTDITDSVPPNLTAFRITGLRPNTNYIFRVAATNDIGTSPYSEESDEVKTLQDIPEGAPRNLVAVPLTTQSLSVTWEEPTAETWNGDLQGYIIQYKQVDMASYQEQTVVYPRHTATLMNLVKFVNYEIRVIAFNVKGNGPPSTPVVRYVGEAAPSAPPQNIKVVSLNSTELNVSWQPPPAETHNGKLLGYKVQYWKTLDGIATATQIIVREQQVLISNLEIFTNYSFTVLTYNLAGEGPKSGIAFGRTIEGLPETPENLKFSNITLTSLKVSWSSPAIPNGIIIAYKLSYFLKQSKDESRTVEMTVNGDRHYVVIDKLDENSTYSFSVAASTSIGSGPKATGQIIIGPQDGRSPGPPSTPTVEMASTNMVQLNWIAGPPGETQILGFYIEAKASSDRYWSNVPIYQVMSNTPRATFAFPTICSDGGCQFRVRAYNAIAISRPSLASELMAPVKPEKPFHYQWWFAVIMALSGLIVILLVISCLCLLSRQRSRDKKKPGTIIATSTNNLESIEPEDGGFASLEMRQSHRSLSNVRNGTLKTAGIYGRAPPRPSPASVTYTEEDGATAKSQLPDDDSSVTEKPSDLGDSNSEPSDYDSEDSSCEKPFPASTPPRSPPPPPFTANPYVSDMARQSWRGHQHNQNAYAYTDSEAESSHYAMSLNGGQMFINNAAGSRAPLPGFSSFV